MENEEKIEPAAMDAYVSAEKQYTEKEWVEYLNARYANVKAAYTSLKLQRDEVEARGQKDKLRQILEGFHENYRARVWVVRALRAAGEKVDDKFVTG